MLCGVCGELPTAAIPATAAAAAAREPAEGLLYMAARDAIMLLTAPLKVPLTSPVMPLTQVVCVTLSVSELPKHPLKLFALVLLQYCARSPAGSANCESFGSGVELRVSPLALKTCATVPSAAAAGASAGATPTGDFSGCWLLRFTTEDGEGDAAIELRSAEVRLLALEATVAGVAHSTFTLDAFDNGPFGSELWDEVSCRVCVQSMLRRCAPRCAVFCMAEGSDSVRSASSSPCCACCACCGLSMRARLAFCSSTRAAFCDGVDRV